MNKIILLLVITLLQSQNINYKSGITSKVNNDISKIIEVIIFHENLNILTNKLETTKFCSELKKIEIEVPVGYNEGLISAPAPGNRYITTILYDNISDEVFFSSKDSSFILSQNSNPKRIKIDKKITNKLNTTTFQNELKKIKNGEDYDFYEMSIPIFSYDKRTAYVELDHRCGHLCGNGRAFYLRKINGKWKIIEKFRTWIS
tara:strand:+ start:75 stop:683 length:609 start_codon:yes stop_codon:yes gene_type:complete